MTKTAAPPPQTIWPLLSCNNVGLTKSIPLILPRSALAISYEHWEVKGQLRSMMIVSSREFYLQLRQASSTIVVDIVQTLMYFLVSGQERSI